MPELGPRPREARLQAINTAYLEAREFACGQYEDVGKEAGPTSDEEVFSEYGIRRSECQVRAFLLTAEELQILNDAIAQRNLEFDKVWASLISARQRSKDLTDVLNQVRHLNNGDNSKK